MTSRTLSRSLAALILIAVLGAAFLAWLQSYREMTEVIFLNIGEGDAILISQGPNQILIDGGRTGKELLARLGRHVPFWDRTIEAVIATHPDADHIGGFKALLSAYTVRKFLSTGAESDTETFALLREALAANAAESLKIFRGGNIRLPYGGALTVEYPLAILPPETEDTNAGSIVSRFTFGATQILLTGDLPDEETVLDGAPADILKVSHHGSKYSTSAVFLDLLQPQEAVISVGKNSYGHPSPDVLKRLAERGIAVYRTDQEGDIRYRCTPALAKCILAR